MLHDLQRQFLEGIFTGDETVLEQIRGDEGLSAREHLAIYRGSVFGILSQALGEIYPVCRRLVGEAFFDALCRRFIARHRPSGHNLQDYGGKLPAFLAGFAPAAGLPYLPGVADLEWAWHRAFHAEDESGFDLRGFSDLKPEQQARATFLLPASATLLQSAYPIDRIWQVNQPESGDDPSVDLGAGGCRLLVWRRGDEMRIDRLDPPQWHLLQAIRTGADLAALADPARLPDLDRSLPEAIARGWVAGFVVRGSG